MIGMDEEAIRTLVGRLSRAHPSGGAVIERAAILAEGTDVDAVVGWILAHDGRPEARATASAGRGLHSARSIHAPSPPARYVLPAGALR